MPSRDAVSKHSRMCSGKKLEDAIKILVSLFPCVLLSVNVINKKNSTPHRPRKLNLKLSPNSLSVLLNLETFRGRHTHIRLMEDSKDFQGLG